MAKNKTVATEASVEEYLASRGTDVQQNDCRALISLLEEITGDPPKMWGPSIVGFGSYSYTYDSGHSGEAPLAGFAIRGREIVLYISCDEEEQSPLLAELGPHRVGKSCLYFKQLEDLDSSVLETLMRKTTESLIQRYGRE